jgi:hypothetical protein
MWLDSDMLEGPTQESFSVSAVVSMSDNWLVRAKDGDSDRDLMVDFWIGHFSSRTRHRQVVKLSKFQ